MITRPLRFSGTELRLNYSTSAVGSIRVEIQNIDGKAIPAFALEDCVEIYGDKLDGPVRWKLHSDVSSLAARSVRLRFVMSDADLYAFRFASK